MLKFSVPAFIDHSMQLTYGRPRHISTEIMLIIVEPMKPMDFSNHLKGSDAFCMKLTLIEMLCNVVYHHPLKV